MALPHKAAHVHWRYTLRQLLWAAVDFVFPPKCGGCRKLGHRFCAECTAAIQYLPTPVCELCGYPRRHSGPETCLNCRRLPLPDRVRLRSVAYFIGPVQKALHRLKYQRDIILADTLATFMSTMWQKNQMPTGLVLPIPLSVQRHKERGYNQAGLLAQGFAELTGLPYHSAALQRVRHTQSQVNLNSSERRANVAEAFQVQARDVMGQTILLVDDVCTTGATLVSAAQTLLQTGATQVWGFTFGRAIDRSGAWQAPTDEVWLGV